MHHRAAHLLQRGVLAGHLLGDPRARQVHRRVARRPSRPSRRTPACTPRPPPTGRAGSRAAAPGPDSRTCRWKIARRAAAAGEEAHLVGEPPARRVDEVDHGEQVAVGPLQDPDLLLAGQLAPRPGLDGEVVGDHRHRAALDAADAGEHAVGREPVAVRRWRAGRPRRSCPGRAARRAGRARAACRASAPGPRRRATPAARLTSSRPRTLDALRGFPRLGASHPECGTRRAIG